MRTHKKMKLLVTGTCLLALAGCGTPNQSTTSSTGAGIPVSTTSSSSGYGVVQSIDLVQGEQPGGIGVGTVAGAVVGAALGNQVGSGTGRTAATVAGAGGGALIGRRMEQNARSPSQGYRVAVRMDNGAVQTLVQDNPPGVQIGERVRLQNGVIVERLR